ncbi:MAG: hypothetical protein J6U40_07585 [Kiritimatiellae bacterium]|nr:hypothetical protein [Kiritimatiellia bacterium]
MASNVYISSMKPNLKPRQLNLGKIPEYQYAGNLKKELAAGTITPAQAVDLLEDMLTVREFEEMIVKLRSGAYDACKGYQYRGPTHVSIGEEATAVGCCSAIAYNDFITSTHRGHGHSIAKGCQSIRGMSVEELKARVPDCASTKKKELI